MAAAWVKDVLQNEQVKNANNVTYTLGTTITAGDHVVIHTLRRNNADILASITSSKGDAVTHVDAAPTGDTWGSHGVGSVYFPTGAAGTDTITVTWTNVAANNFFGCCMVEYSGLATSNWWDKTVSNPASGTAIFSSSPDSGLAAATTADGLVFAALQGQDNTVTLTPGAGYTARTREVASGSYGSMDQLDKLGTSGTQYKANGTYSANASWYATVVTYKAALAAFTPRIVPVVVTG